MDNTHALIELLASLQSILSLIREENAKLENQIESESLVAIV